MYNIVGKGYLDTVPEYARFTEEEVNEYMNLLTTSLSDYGLKTLNMFDAWAKVNFNTTDIKDIIGIVLDNFLSSDMLKSMEKGREYFLNKTDIKDKTPATLNEINNQLEIPVFRKLVNQKAGYLLSKAPTIKPSVMDESTKEYYEELKKVWTKSNLNSLMNAAKESIYSKSGWLYFSENAFTGELEMTDKRTTNVIPIYYDENKKDFVGIIYISPIINYGDEQKNGERVVYAVEFYTAVGIQYFEYNSKDGETIESTTAQELYGDSMIGNIVPYSISPIEGMEEEGYRSNVWGEIPFVEIKYNDEYFSLYDGIKDLADAYNMIRSLNLDSIEEFLDYILLIYGYAQYSAEETVAMIKELKVAMLNENKGEIKKLQFDMQQQAFNDAAKSFRGDIYDFGGGFDPQDENLGNVSGTALRNKRSGLSDDSNIHENQILMAMEKIERLVNSYLETQKNIVIPEGAEWQVALNRDESIMIDETIAAIKNSMGILPLDELIAQHPWSDADSYEKLMIENGADPYYTDSKDSEQLSEEVGQQQEEELGEVETNEREEIVNG